MLNHKAGIFEKKKKERKSESTFYEYPSNYEVEKYKQCIDVEEEELIMKIWYEK